VKLAEFNALCEREWEKRDRGGRGDVVRLTLTEAGYEELSADILADQSRLPFDLPPEPCACHPHILMVHPIALVNPITRTQVGIRVKKSVGRETARVRVMGGTCRETWWPATA
jgi:hypothetical protein